MFYTDFQSLPKAGWRGFYQHFLN